MAQMLNASGGTFPGNWQRGMAAFDRSGRRHGFLLTSTNYPFFPGKGFLNFEDFVYMNDRYPLILYPAFEVQKNFRQHTLGRRGWNNVLERLHEEELVAHYLDEYNHLPPHLLSEIKWMGRLKFLFPCLMCTPKYTRVKRLQSRIAFARGAVADQRQLYDEMYLPESLVQKTHADLKQVRRCACIVLCVELNPSLVHWFWMYSLLGEIWLLRRIHSLLSIDGWSPKAKDQALVHPKMMRLTGSTAGKMQIYCFCLLRHEPEPFITAMSVPPNESQGRAPCR